MRRDIDVSKGSRMPTLGMRDLEDFFDRTMRDPFSLLDEMRPTLGTDTPILRPHFDLDETDQAYLLYVDVPGVKREDLNVDLNENVLTISGERKTEKVEGEQRVERSYGRFSRSFTLPSTVDPDKVEARCEEGVLKIALPKSEKSRSRSIDVQSGKGGGFFSKLTGSSEKGEKEKGKSKSESTRH